MPYYLNSIHSVVIKIKPTKLNVISFYRFEVYGLLKGINGLFFLMINMFFMLADILVFSAFKHIKLLFREQTPDQFTFNFLISTHISAYRPPTNFEKLWVIPATKKHWKLHSTDAQDEEDLETQVNCRSLQVQVRDGCQILPMPKVNI